MRYLLNTDNMKNQTFEDFLMEYHAENEAEGVLDDDLPDAYEGWVTNLEPDEIIELANKAIIYYRKQTINEMYKNAHNNQ